MDARERRIGKNGEALVAGTMGDRSGTGRGRIDKRSRAQPRPGALPRRMRVDERFVGRPSSLSSAKSDIQGIAVIVVNVEE